MSSEVDTQGRYYRDDMELAVDPDHVRSVRKLLGIIARRMTVVDGYHLVASGSTESKLANSAAYLVRFCAQNPETLNGGPGEAHPVHDSNEIVLLSGVQNGVVEAALFGKPDNGIAPIGEVQSDTPLQIIGDAERGWQLVLRVSDEAVA